MGCITHKENSYQIYVDEDSSDNFIINEQILDNVDSSLNTVEALVDYVGQNNSEADENPTTYWLLNDSVFDYADRNEPNRRIDYLETEYYKKDSVHLSSVNAKKEEIAAAKLPAETSFDSENNSLTDTTKLATLDLLSMDWARPIYNNIPQEIDSVMLEEMMDSISSIQVDNVSLLHVVEDTVKKEKREMVNSQPLYIIDRNLDQPGMTYVIVDTIASISNLKSDKKVIVIRKYNLNVEEEYIKRLNVDSIGIKEIRTEVIKPVENQSIYFSFQYEMGQLKPSNKEELIQVLNAAKENRDKTVSISSRTDASGSSALNLKISRQRVEEVKKYLIDGGVAEQRIFVQYFGEKYADPEGVDTDRVTSVTLK